MEKAGNKGDQTGLRRDSYEHSDLLFPDSIAPATCGHGIADFSSLSKTKKVPQNTEEIKNQKTVARAFEMQFKLGGSEIKVE